MGGKARDALEYFINSVADGKIDGFTDGEHELVSDRDFHLDNQGLTSGTPQFYNLQIQVSNSVTISTLKKHKKKTVAGPVLVPIDGSWNAAKIGAELLKAIKI